MNLKSITLGLKDSWHVLLAVITTTAWLTYFGHQIYDANQQAHQEIRNLLKALELKENQFWTVNDMVMLYGDVRYLTNYIHAGFSARKAIVRDIHIANLP